MTALTWWGLAPLERTGACVLALDPGLRHGLAHLRGDGAVEAGEAGWQEGLATLETLLDCCCLASTLGPPVLVGESFFITTETGKKSQAPWSLEGLGVLRYLAGKHGLRLVTQPPSEAKGFATRRRLVERGWWVSTEGGHAADALRHLYLHLAKAEGLLPPPGVV